MQQRKKVQTVIWCGNCRKNIKVNNYRLHIWFCTGSDKINPVLQNMFKSQLHMSKKLHQLIKNQPEDVEETFPCAHCSFPMKFIDFDTHPSKCKFLPIECPFCKIQFPKDLMQQHQKVCQVKKKYAKNVPLAKTKSLPTPTPTLKDEITIDEHVQFLMRELAHNLGVMKSKALTNKQLIDLHKSSYKKNNKNKGQEQVCPICDIEFEEGQNLVKLPCSHQYHRRCICHWFSIANTCPMCRYQLEKKK